MPDLVKVEFARSDASGKTNDMGMRPMQERVYEARNAQYLLLKAPPASGKSRALMYVALDKMRRQGIRKSIVSVPERSIGNSFRSTDLTRGGFPYAWSVEPRWNLCTTGSETAGKVAALEAFLASDDEVLVCTHATLRFAFDKVGARAFDGMLVAIDEFHHSSADVGSRLGEIVRSLIQESDAHVVAMTGSYFRGDTTPVLRPEDEALFTHVTFTYYEQIEGYEHLRSLGIGYHFFRGSYLDAIGEILDPDLKTIIHIPSVGSGESTGDKYAEADRICDAIGIYETTDEATGFYLIRSRDGDRIYRVADLVDDEPRKREKVLSSLRDIQGRDDVDVIIALGMAKEGFDWIWCEHALTVGYRGSLTEVVQIIGRATRDAPGKEHAQFTNLIPQPDATEGNVLKAVNDMLKAITCSLLMEQVLAPNFKFRTLDDVREEKERPTTIVVPDPPGTIRVPVDLGPSTERVRELARTSLNELTAAILQDSDVLRESIADDGSPEVVNQVYVPMVIRRTHPDLTDEEVEYLRRAYLTRRALAGGLQVPTPENLPTNALPNDQSGVGSLEGDQIADDEKAKDNRLVRLANSFVRLDQLTIDLIDSVNPFHNAYEILSKSLSAETMKLIHSAVGSTRSDMTEEEAVALWPRIVEYRERHGEMPRPTCRLPIERRMAEAVQFLEIRMGQRQAAKAAS